MSAEHFCRTFQLPNALGSFLSETNQLQAGICGSVCPPASTLFLAPDRFDRYPKNIDITKSVDKASRVLEATSKWRVLFKKLD
jgi:hypothetical protein